MADSLLFVGWNKAVPGKEHEAVTAFGETVQFYTDCVERGEIESFEPYFLQPHGGDLNGFFLLHGEPANLGALQDSEEFLRVLTKATLSVEGIGVIRGVTGNRLGEQMGIYSELIS